MTKPKEYTTAEAAEKLGLARISVQLYLRRGKIIGTKFGPTWKISEAEIMRFAKRNKRPGPAPKPVVAK